MRPLVALLLLAACGNEPPRWSRDLQRSVFGQCYQQKPSKAYCSGYAFALEQYSPNPTVEFTPEDFQKATVTCEPEAL